MFASTVNVTDAARYTFSGKIYSVTRIVEIPTVPATEFVSMGNAANAMPGIFLEPIICVTRLVMSIPTVPVTVPASMGNVSVVIPDATSGQICSVTNHKPGTGVIRVDPIVTAHILRK
jgi:hypothetical protein